jgi:hypothetical protein
MTAQVDADNAAFYEHLAADEFAKGDVGAGLYFLDAADYWAEPSPATVTARIYLLDAAMDKLSDRTEQR